jgi:hypothetical protein
MRAVVGFVTTVTLVRVSAWRVSVIGAEQQILGCADDDRKKGKDAWKEVNRRG